MTGKSIFGDVLGNSIAGNGRNWVGPAKPVVPEPNRSERPRDWRDLFVDEVVPVAPVAAGNAGAGSDDWEPAVGDRGQVAYRRPMGHEPMPDPSAPRNKPVWSFKEASMTSRAAENAQKEASIRQLNLARQDRTFAYSPSPNGKFTRFDDMPVNWLELGKSSMGMVGSGLGVLAGDALLGTGGALMIAPEPVVTKLSGAALLVGGGALVARSATGFALNGANFYKALKGAPSGPDYLPGSALELAAKSMGGSDNIVRVAQASDMAIDVASGAAFRNVSIFNGAARYTASYPALLQQPRMMVSIEAAANAYSPVAWKLGTSTWGGYVGVGSAYTGVYDAGASAGWWGTPYVSVMEKK